MKCAGPKRPHLGVCPGPNIPLQGRQGSRGQVVGYEALFPETVHAVDEIVELPDGRPVESLRPLEEVLLVVPNHRIVGDVSDECLAVFGLGPGDP